MRDGSPGGEGLTVMSQSIDGGEESKPGRLPRWTRQEILVLIQGKRDAEERRGSGERYRRSGGLEPKWAAISSYCRRHGVDRGPVQCRKRWSNLSGDFRKIKEWEREAGGESFWVMRNDVRREKRLPGFFDREVYDILNGGASQATAAEVVFDTGRPSVDVEGLFSDVEPSGREEAEEGDPQPTLPPMNDTNSPDSPEPALPISSDSGAANEHPPNFLRCSHPGAATEQQQQQPDRNPEGGSTAQDRKKRKKPLEDDDDGETDPQAGLVEILERNSQTLATLVEAQSASFQLERKQRKDHAENLVGVLSKLADALGRIADKL